MGMSPWLRVIGHELCRLRNSLLKVAKVYKSHEDWFILTNIVSDESKPGD